MTDDAGPVPRVQQAASRRAGPEGLPRGTDQADPPCPDRRNPPSAHRDWGGPGMDDPTRWRGRRGLTRWMPMMIPLRALLFRRIVGAGFRVRLVARQSHWS